MEKKKGNWSTLFLVIILLVGLSLLLYPTVSDWWNSYHQSRAIASYVENVEALDEITCEELWNDAVAYNQTLIGRPYSGYLTEEEQEEYERLLDVSGNGIIGYITIPKIDCNLPIYHGIDEGVLQIAIGHIGGSSLPVGGDSTHCVLSGHRGLPRAKLFTNLDELEVGDTFTLTVLDRCLTYEVDQLLIVLPHEVEELEIERGKDYCTLVTCTPYGINTHRLLVRGHRVDTVDEEAAAYVTADATQIEPMIVVPIVAIPFLLILLVILLLQPKRRQIKPEDIVVTKTKKRR